MKIKEVNVNDTFLSRESKITLIDKKIDSNYEVYISHDELLTTPELQVISSLTDEQIASVDVSQLEETKGKKSFIDVVKGWFKK